MALLPVLAIAAALGAPGASAALLVRWLLGAALAGLAVVRVGEPRLLPLALVYEPVALVVGLAVAARRARATEVEWGGIRYPLRRRAETARG